MCKPLAAPRVPCPGPLAKASNEINNHTAPGPASAIPQPNRTRQRTSGEGNSNTSTQQRGDTRGYGTCTSWQRAAHFSLRTSCHSLRAAPAAPGRAHYQSATLLSARVSACALATCVRIGAIDFEHRAHASQHKAQRERHAGCSLSELCIARSSAAAQCQWHDGSRSADMEPTELLTELMAPGLIEPDAHEPLMNPMKMTAFRTPPPISNVDLFTWPKWDGGRERRRCRTRPGRHAPCAPRRPLNGTFHRRPTLGTDRRGPCMPSSTLHTFAGNP